MSKILQVDRVSDTVIDFAEADGYLFVALVCRAWLRSWGGRPRETRPIAESTTISQLREASDNDLPLYDLCSSSAALDRRDLVYYSRLLGSPWTNSLAQAATQNDLSLIKYLREIGCPMSPNTFEVACFNGDTGVMKYLMQSGCPSGKCVEYAASSANIATLEWLKNNGCRLEAGGFAAACLTGNIEVIRWFERNKSGWDDRVTSHSARSGNPSALQLVIDLGYRWGTETTKAAAGLESMSILVWLHENGCPWGQSTCAQASRDGRLGTLIWARSRGCDWGPSVCSLAAEYGHFDVLKWAVLHGCEWNSATLRGAASAGRLDILKWAVERGCPSTDDVYVCASAGIGSNLPILRWLREEKGFAWDASTLAYAAGVRCFQVVQYCLDKSCLVDETVVQEAVRSNRFQMVKFLVTRGFPVDEDACVSAAASGNLQVLEYLWDKGYVEGKSVEKCLGAATMNRRVECMAWIKRQQQIIML